MEKEPSDRDIRERVQIEEQERERKREREIEGRKKMGSEEK